MFVCRRLAGPHTIGLVFIFRSSDDSVVCSRCRQCGFCVSSSIPNNTRFIAFSTTRVYHSILQYQDWRVHRNTSRQASNHIFEPNLVCLVISHSTASIAATEQVELSIEQAFPCRKETTWPCLLNMLVKVPRQFAVHSNKLPGLNPHNFGFIKELKICGSALSYSQGRG